MGLGRSKKKVGIEFMACVITMHKSIYDLDKTITFFDRHFVLRDKPIKIK